MFCKNCGNEVADNAYICLKCGAKVNDASTTAKDSDSVGWWFLGFFLPFVGLIVWLTCHDSTPKMARKAGIGAICGVIATVVCLILYYLLFVVLTFSMMSMAI